ncbi:MAG: hypothetical protein LBT71_03770 [Azoarcus sp.]|jgi:hypothetical protein|nr:hypothetical protein [Azoarcus sp.]
MKTMKLPWGSASLSWGVAGVLFDIVSAFYFSLSGKLIEYHSPNLTFVDTLVIHVWKIVNYPALLCTEWAFNLVFDVYNTFTPTTTFFYYYLALSVPLFGVGYAFGYMVKFIKTGLAKTSAGLDSKYLGIQLAKCAGIAILVLSAIIAVDEGLRFILADELATKNALINEIRQ